MEDVEKVLSKLKSGKSRDPNGLINELFHKSSIGSDLKQSLLLLVNKIKENLEFPEFSLLGNIFSIYKGKGDRKSLDNE